MGPASCAPTTNNGTLPVSSPSGTGSDVIAYEETTRESRTERVESRQQTLIAKSDVVRIHVPYKPDASPSSSEVTVTANETNRTVQTGNGSSPNKRLSDPPR